MMFMKKFIYLILLLLFSGSIIAQSSELLFEKGNQAYNNKQYEQALKSYLLIEKSKNIITNNFTNCFTTFILNNIGISMYLALMSHFTR